MRCCAAVRATISPDTSATSPRYSGAIRHHARHRHAASARHRARDSSPRWRIRSIAHATRRRRPARRRRLRHPAAARRDRRAGRAALGISRACIRATRASIRTRAPCPTSIRMYSAKARSSAKASTTSTRSSTCLRDASARQPHPQPRFARRLLRALGIRERHRTARRLSDQLSRRRAPPASLDSRRLADRALAAPFVRARDGRLDAQSAERVVALESARQPAPQPGAGRVRAVARCSAGPSCPRRGSGQRSWSAFR